MTQQLLLDILPGNPPTLDGFIHGANASAHQAVCTLAAGRALYLWGGPGCGRSHLLRASTAPAACHYVEAAQAARRLPALALDENLVLQRVAVDDVDQLDASGQAALFALFNRWRTAGAGPAGFAILCAGPCAPRALGLREDLRTRLAWDLVFRLEQLSDAQRLQALRERAQQRGLTLSDELLRWILTHRARDMGQLTALIDALDRYSLARHRPITLPLLKELLSDPLPSGSP